MPHASLTITDGVNQERTPTLNEFGLTTTQLVRYRVDNHYILVEKQGGWSRFINTQTVAKVRGLWAWEDTENQGHLAVGCENIAGTYTAQLAVATNGALKDVTPRQGTDNITPAASATSGSAFIEITDATTESITQYDSVYIPAHISIGGVVLFGLYTCNPDGHSALTTFTVEAVDALGAPLAASSTTTTTTVASFATTTDSATVTVTLASHGYIVGSTYPVLVLTTVGGITLFGNYIVQSVSASDTFTITGSTNATDTTTGSINAGKARFIYSFGVGALAGGTGYGIDGYGTGGYGSGAAISPSLGNPISAFDWNLDNWGEVAIASADTPAKVLATTATSGDGTTGTVTFTPAITVDVGESVTIAGVTPTGWNGTHVVSASSAGSVSFATTLTSSQTVAGTLTVNQTPFQPLYFYDVEAGQPIAQAIPQAPPYSTGFFVAMPEKQIIAWGTTDTGVPDPLLVRWCDLNNFNSWIGTVTNQAGKYRIPRGSQIVGAIQGPQQGLIWTDIGLWSMQYVNQPLIYGFNEIGSGCGLIAKKAAAALNGVVYWMGPSQFYTLSGDGVQPLPCPVWDVAFQDLDTANLAKIRIAVNSRFNEVAWYFPTSSSAGEVAAYVRYNTLVGLWDYGLLARSAWIDQSVLGPPIGSDPNTLLIYQHETSPDADGAPLVASFRTGYAALSDGDEMSFVDQFWPDFKFGPYGGAMNATIQLTFYVADYPGATPRTYGPYSITQATTAINPSFRGRLVQIGVESSDIGSFWRTGRARYRISAAGKY